MIYDIASKMRVASYICRLHEQQMVEAGKTE
jgi:hypothetical protein